MTEIPVRVHVAGSFRHGPRLLFEDIDYGIEAGRWNCLLGPSGIGKSTLLRMIAGLDTGGEFVGGITGADGSRFTEPVSYMAQSDLLLPWLSVRDNVVLGATLRGERPQSGRAARLIDRVGLTEHADKKPPQLSGGMRQRAALARLLMEDRELVLLDEPFSALDARTRFDMQALAFEVLEGHSVLLVTHDPFEAARLGHRIHVLDGYGLHAPAMPPTPPLRRIDDVHTVHMQASLMAALGAA